MNLTEIPTIPNACTMLQRAFVYMDSAGNYYVQIINSPNGADSDNKCYSASGTVGLTVAPGN